MGFGGGGCGSGFGIAFALAIDSNPYCPNFIFQSSYRQLQGIPPRGCFCEQNHRRCIFPYREAQEKAPNTCRVERPSIYQASPKNSRKKMMQIVR